MLPDILNEIFENNDPEDISISILKAESENRELKITIEVSGYDFGNHTWQIDTVNYRAGNILFDTSHEMEIRKEHPLLWQFSDEQSELYFSGYTDNVEKLFFDLHKVHYSNFYNLSSFEESLNLLKDFKRLIGSKNGLLARGSNKLMRLYAQILEAHEMEYSIIGNRIPTFWDGAGRVEETGTAKVLFIDNSYIIADEFVFKPAAGTSTSE